MAFFSMFRRSALELKSVRSLTVTALLTAVSVVLEFLVIQPTPSLKFGFSFLGLAAIGMLYGPVVGAVSGVAVDVLGWLVRPTGSFSPVLTAATLVEGLIYGIFLYKMSPAKLEFSNGGFLRSLKQNAVPALRAFCARLTVNVVCNVFLNTLGLFIMGYIAEESFWPSIWARVAKNAVLLPFEAILLIAVTYMVAVAYRAAAGKHKNIV